MNYFMLLNNYKIIPGDEIDDYKDTPAIEFDDYEMAVKHQRKAFKKYLLFEIEELKTEFKEKINKIKNVIEEI